MKLQKRTSIKNQSCFGRQRSSEAGQAYLEFLYSLSFLIIPCLFVFTLVAWRVWFQISSEFLLQEYIFCQSSKNFSCDQKFSAKLISLNFFLRTAQFQFSDLNPTFEAKVMAKTKIPFGLFGFPKFDTVTNSLRINIE